MQDSKLKVAVISAGMISNAAHIPAYKSIPDLVDIAAVCDVNPVSSEATAKRHGIPRWYTDAEEMLLREKPDLVSVCTPNMAHKPMTMLALKHGCNVACEKPLAMTYKDTKEMFDFAKSVGKTLFACQTVRYNDEYQFAREMFDNGTLGDVYYSEFSLIRRRGVPKWGTFHTKDANGGGAFCDLGVHLVDAALWVMGGKRFASITGTSAASDGQYLSDVAAGDSPLMTITYNYLDASKPADVMTLYAGNTRRVNVDINGVIEFDMRASFVDAVKLACEHTVSGEPIEENW